MSDATPTRPPRRRRRAGRVGLWTVFVFLTVFLLTIFTYLSLTGRALVVPRWATDRIEERLNAAIAVGSVGLGRIDVEVTRGGVPRIRLRNVALIDGSGARLGEINEVGVGLSGPALLKGEVRPSTLKVSGAQVTLRRDNDGRLSLGLGGGGGTVGTLAGVIDAVEAVFRDEALSGIQDIEADDLTITLEDARSGRLWQATDGRLKLVNGDRNVSTTVYSEVFNGTENLAEVQLAVQSSKADASAQVGITVRNADARDIALQSPVLSYLELLDTQISGAMRTTMDADGKIDGFAATLDLGAGALQPTPDLTPVRFDRGRVYLSFDPETQKITFSDIDVSSDALRIAGRGRAYLEFGAGLWPEAVIGQLSFSHITLSPEGVFPEPVSFSRGSADFRLGLRPFALDLAQAVIVEDDRRFVFGGRVGAGSDGWSVGMDLTVADLTIERLMQLWPLKLAPRTRDWFSENALSGRFRNVAAAVRMIPGQRDPEYGFSVDFEDLDLTPLKRMPAITGGKGHAAVHRNRFGLRLDRGIATPELGGPVDLAGSTYFVPNMRAQPARAHFDINTESTLTAVLSLLDNPPVNAMQRAGRPADLADAEARLHATLEVPLKQGLTPQDIAYEVSGTLGNLVSDKIAPGRRLTGDELEVAVTPQLLRVFGPMAIDGLPLRMVWEQPMGRGAMPESRVEATVELSERFTETFGIGLPDGSVTGLGQGLVSLEVARDKPMEFRLSSDLRGVALDLPSIGWQKPAERPAGLEVTGRLGPIPEIDRIALKGPGLDAEGTVTLGQNGEFVSADFSRLEVGEWLDAAVRLEGQGAGAAPTVRVTGGTLDLRELDLRKEARGAGGEPIELALDRLVISEGISLVPFQGEIRSGQGLSGTFRAAVNAGAPIRGTLFPVENGTAVRIFADDAGAVARSAGIMKSLSGGTLDLILTPRPDGAYDGQIRIAKPSLRDQPAIAELLNAISVVGIIDQLRGPGIQFETMDGRFRLTDDRLFLDKGVAVGASLGLTLDGTYDLAGKRLDMEGVISPVYMLNGIGQIISRPGEGFFGFTYRMTGPAADPKVSVNPLSILAPGVIRDIFRSTPRPGQTNGQ